MENKNGKFTIKSTAKALKFQKRMFIFWLLLWGSGFIFSAHLALRNYSDYSVMKTKFVTVVNEIKKEASAEKAKEEEKAVVYDQFGNPFHILTHDGVDYEQLIKSLHEPTLLDDTHFYLYLLLNLSLAAVSLLDFCVYRNLVSQTKNFLEFDGETGEILFFKNYIFNQSSEHRRVFDVITGIDVSQGIYCRALNVGELTIHGKYLFADEVYEVEWTLRFCDNIKESVEKINEFIRKRGMGAVKVEIS